MWAKDLQGVVLLLDRLDRLYVFPIVSGVGRYHVQQVTPLLLMHHRLDVMSWIVSIIVQVVDGDDSGSLNERRSPGYRQYGERACQEGSPVTYHSGRRRVQGLGAGEVLAANPPGYRPRRGDGRKGVMHLPHDLMSEVDRVGTDVLSLGGERAPTRDAPTGDRCCGGGQVKQLFPAFAPEWRADVQFRSIVPVSPPRARLVRR